MKIALFLMFLLVTAVQANGLAQRVSLSASSMKIEDFFSEISRQTNHRFFYSSEVARTAGKVRVDLRNVSVEEALRRVLDQNKFEFKVIAGTVTINLKENSKGAIRPLEAQQQNTVMGSVKDSSGKPLSGASISVKGANRLAVSASDGSFSIEASPTATLVIVYVGYQTVEIPVQNRANVNIVLEEVSSEIDAVDVVATGYQNLDRRLFTGATSKIDAKDAERVGIPDVSRMLEGQAAGVTVQNVSGTFGAAPKIRVRGATSISGDNKPLWVIDGIVLEDVVNISNDQLSTGDANTLIGSSVAGLNPDDIESFSILKDAAATAMYGARAMNGVIVVTTKKGKITAGQPHLSYTANLTSYLKPNYSDYNIMNSADQVELYLEMESKGYLNQADVVGSSNWGVFGKMYDMMYQVDPITNDYALVQSPEARSAYLRSAALRNTDWFDVLFRNSLLQEHSISLSSGTEKSQIYASTSFLQDHGWTIADKVKRFTGNVRGNFKLSSKVQAELLATGSIRDQISPGTEGRVTNVVSGQYERNFDNNPFSFALNTSRALAAFDENGNNVFYQKNYAPFSILHELENNTLQTSGLDFKVQGNISWKILPTLKYAFDGAYRYVKTKQEHRVLETANAAEAYRAGTEYDPRGKNSIIIGNNRLLWTDPDNPSFEPVSIMPYGGVYRSSDVSLVNYYMRNSLNWNTRFGEKHDVDFFGTAEIRFLDRQNSWFDGVGYQYDKGGVVYFDPNYFKKLSLSNDDYYGMGYEWDRYVAFMARGAYAYDDKYSVNATVRYDGSNKLGTSRTARWLPTWNISGAWNLDQESFFEPIESWMSQARVRATYGLVASMGAATNSAAIFRNTNTERPFFVDRESIIGISSLENSELTWEKQYETNLGFDLGFLNNRLTLTVDLYKRKQFDLIGLFRTSGIDGQASKYANYADMDSKGMEYTVQYKILNRTDWKWNVRTNLAYHKNRVTSLQNRPRIWDVVRQEGGALEEYPVRGLFSIKFDKLGENGLPYFFNESNGLTTNVNMQSTTVDYLDYHGPLDATLAGGFFNSIAYKGLSLGALFTFSAGNYVRLTPSFRSSYTDVDAVNNALLSRWLIYGDERYTTAPVVVGKSGGSTIAGYPFNNYNYSNVRVAKGDFIRLKQVMMTYQIPSALTSKFWARTASVSFVANNLWLLYSDAALQGQDPEFFESGGVSLPIQRQFSLSLKFGF
ncbi:SusC/RagA family TonB-linked outer membrane protein [Sphingobacterium olei]|nr:SusC/RagA family TonB-linked outer membrane protein [Sphingobacterium olei]